MKKTLIFLFLLVAALQVPAQQFNDYFLDKTLRFDYIHAGNADTAFIYFQQLKEEPYWGGSQINLIDKFNYGDYRFLVFDSVSNQLLYSRGYSTLFYEWQDTPEARTMDRSFYESVVFPYPKNTVRLLIQQRNFENEFYEVYEIFINPTNYFIKQEQPFEFTTEKFHISGDPHQKLDIVIIPEGYTAEQMDKFHKDAERFIGYFFGVSPFKENKDKVNFWGVNAISEESGTDIPGDNIWKNTILNTHFYTFYSERYLTTSDVETMRDIAALVPYDQIYVLVNTSKYGGGGIYNYYNLCMSDHPQARQVFTHEFGHAFAALADEYDYGISDPVGEVYNLEMEPWQANITTLIDFETKWKHLVDEDTPLPTPETAEHRNRIGAFEGAGYVKTKIYRPVYDCKMRSNNTDEFCPVCKEALLQMLLFYAE